MDFPRQPVLVIVFRIAAIASVGFALYKYPSIRALVPAAVAIACALIAIAFKP